MFASGCIYPSTYLYSRFEQQHLNTPIDDDDDALLNQLKLWPSLKAVKQIGGTRQKPLNLPQRPPRNGTLLRGGTYVVVLLQSNPGARDHITRTLKVDKAVGHVSHREL